MSCEIEDFINKTNNLGVRIDKKKIEALKKKGSKAKKDDFFDSLPLDEKVMSLKNGEFIDMIYDILEEDIVSKNNPKYNEYLKSLEDSIGAIDDFLYNSKNNEKIRVKHYESNNGTFGTYSGETNTDIQEIEVFKDDNIKSSTQSEVLIHEMVHSIAKGAFKLEPDVRKKARDIKNIVDSFDTDYTMFLSLVDNPSQQDIEDAKDKYDYVMKDKSDLEEFIAYFISNPSLQYEVNRMIYDYVENDNGKASRFNKKNPQKLSKKEKENLSSAQKSFANIKYMLESSILKNHENDPVSKVVNKDSNKYSKGIKKDLNYATNEIIDSIINFRTKIQTKQDKTIIGDLFDIGSGKITEKVVPKLISSPLKFTGDFIDSTVGKFVNKTKRNRIYRKTVKHFNKISDYLKDKGMDKSKKIVKILRRVKIIDDILKSELFIDLWRQFVSSESTGENAIYYRIARRADKIRSNIEYLRKNIIDNLNILEDFGTTKQISANDTLLKIFKGELSYFGDFLLSGSLSRGSINDLFDNFSSEFLDENLKQEVMNLVDFSFTHSGKAPRNINIEMIVKNKLKLKGRSSKEAIKELKKYARLYSMTKLSNSDIDILNEISTNSDMKKNLINVFNSHKTRLESLIKSYYDNNAENTLPFGYIKEDKDSTVNTVRYLPLKEAKSLLVKGTFLRIVKGSEVNIFGQKMVKVYSKDISPSFSDGLLKVSSEDIGGIGLRNTLEYALRSKRSKLFENKLSRRNIKKDKEIDMNIDEIIDILSKENSVDIENIIGFKKEELYPIYDQYGKIVDFKIPISYAEKSSIQNQNMNISSRISDTIFSLADIRATRTHNQKVIDLISEKSFDNIDKLKNNEKYVDLRTVDGFTSKFEFKSLNEPLYVDRELIPLFLGSRQSSLSNISIFGTSLSNKNVKDVIKTFEKILSSITSKYKQVIALLTPDVVIGNMVSNAYVAKEKGIDFEDFVIKFKDNWTQLNEIQEMYDELGDLKSKLTYAVDDYNDVKKDIDNLSYSIKNHPAYSLVNDGQLSLTMEDIDVNEKGFIRNIFNSKFYSKDSSYQELVLNVAYQLRGNSNKPIEDFIEDAERKIKRDRIHVPKLAKNIAKIAYVDSDTVVAKKAKKLLMYGDAITKKIILDKYKEDYLRKHNREMPESIENRKLDELAELFVSYSTNESGIQKWVENVGMVTFMKYQFRTTKGYLKHLMQNRARGFAGHLSQVLFDVDIPDPLDSNFKNGPMDSLINKEKLDDLGDVLYQNMTPHFLKAIGF